MARTRAGKLRHTWAAPTLPLQLKLRLYKAVVCSIMTYGSEAWLLDNATCKALNGANAAMLAIITGKSIQQEACRSTTTFDILPWIRGKRLQWVGHILRLPPTRLLHRTLQHIHDQAIPGDMLMDAPIGEWKELVKLAEDRKGWRIRVRKLKAAATPNASNKNQTAAHISTISNSTATTTTAAKKLGMQTADHHMQTRSRTRSLTTCTAPARRKQNKRKPGTQQRAKPKPNAQKRATQRRLRREKFAQLFAPKKKRRRKISAGPSTAVATITTAKQPRVKLEQLAQYFVHPKRRRRNNNQPASPDRANRARAQRNRSGDPHNTQPVSPDRATPAHARDKRNRSGDLWASPTSIPTSTREQQLAQLRLNRRKRLVKPPRPTTRPTPSPQPNPTTAPATRLDPDSDSDTDTDRDLFFWPLPEPRQDTDTDSDTDPDLWALPVPLLDPDSVSDSDSLTDTDTSTTSWSPPPTIGLTNKNQTDMTNMTDIDMTNMTDIDIDIDMTNMTDMITTTTTTKTANMTNTL